MSANKPLSVLLRPKTLDDIIGQEHLVQANGVLARMVAKQIPYSFIFYGPPGIGKTSLALCLAHDLQIPYAIFNATIDNKSKLADLIIQAQQHESFILIIEEIHRLNKDKQDIFLSYLENNHFYVFITTTENPFFCINPALRSRCQIAQLKSITNEQLSKGISSLITKNALPITLTENQIKTVIYHVNGDLRAAINIIDILIKLYSQNEITDALLAQILQQPLIGGSHFGDEMHDLKSALHKSLRGSDVDASLHYLARLINLGALDEIARRLLEAAYEDVGLANPNLALRVSIGIESAYRLGLPIAIEILGVLCIEIASSPKSNAASTAIHAALDDLEVFGNCQIPFHIRDQSYASAKKVGATGYLYPHNYPHNYVTQQYLPIKLVNKVNYYQPPLTSEQEQKLVAFLKQLKK